jgi:hypothetical protein
VWFGSEFVEGIWIDALQMFAIHDQFLEFFITFGYNFFVGNLTKYFNRSIDRQILRQSFFFFLGLGLLVLVAADQILRPKHVRTQFGIKGCYGIPPTPRVLQIHELIQFKFKSNFISITHKNK